MMTAEIKPAKASDVFVNGNQTSLTVLTDDGKKLRLLLPVGPDKALLSLMADGLLKRNEKKFDRETGALLAEAELKPLRIEKKLGKLGIQEKFVLQISSESGTEVTFRLSDDSLRKWIDTAETQMAERRSKNKKLS